MPRRRPLVSLLFAPVVALVVAGGCTSDSETEVAEAAETSVPGPTAAPVTTEDPAAEPARRVAIVGDSITVQSASALRQRIVGDVEIAARTFARTIDMVAAADRLAGTEPDVVIVNLGTNDEACATVGGCTDGYAPDATEVSAGFARVLEPFDVDCRLVVTITYDVGHPPLVNPVLTGLDASGDVDGVIDWVAHWRAEEPADEPWLLDFEGHLSPAGADALASLVATQIDEQCPTVG